MMPPAACLGLSVEGLENLLRENAGAIAEGATTSDVWHAVVKPLTVPKGLVDAAPAGTRSYCELLLAEANTAVFVRKPTMFLCHSWQSEFHGVVRALRNFVDRLPPGSPQTFIWIDCFSIDRHMSQEWLRTTIHKIISLIGHTVMVLSPWRAPQTLEMAQSWELFTTASEGLNFSVCLAPEEQRKVEEAILENHTGLLDALASIRIAHSQAMSEMERLELLGRAGEAPGGCGELKGVVLEMMKGWVVDTAWRLIEAAAERDELCTKAQVANLFSTLQMVGEAEALYREVAAGHTVQYGDGHAETLTSKMNLAVLLQNQGTAAAVAEAKALHRAVVAGRIACYGPDHVQTLESKNSLAILLKQHECTPAALAEAKALYSEVVAGFTAQYGSAHVETLTGKQNLATLLAAEGTAKAVVDAKTLYREVIAGRVAHYGPDHIETLRSKYKLGALLGNNVTLPEPMVEATALYRDVVAGFAKYYGAGHVQTLKSKGSLARLLKHAGSAEAFVEAKSLHREVAEGFAAHYGSEHVTTLNSQYNLARLLKKEASVEAVAEAVQLCSGVCAGFTAAYGPSHRNTKMSERLMAQVLKASKDRGMEAVAEEVVPTTDQDTGTPTTASRDCKYRILSARGSLFMLGVPPHDLRAHTESEAGAEAGVESKAMYREAVRSRTAEYGDKHVETLRSKNNLANLLKNEGSLEQWEAQLLYREVIEGFTAHSGGGEHVTTLACKYNLATLLATDGKLEAVAEAVQLCSGVCAGFTAAYGPSHRHTQMSERLMAQVLKASEGHRTVTPEHVLAANDSTRTDTNS